MVPHIGSYFLLGEFFMVLQYGQITAMGDCDEPQA